MLKVWFQRGLGKVRTKIDAQMFGVSDKTAFRHEGQHAYVAQVRDDLPALIALSLSG